MTGWVWLASDDAVRSADEAMVPFATPAVLFGESLFETFRLREGRVYRLEAHLKRMRESLQALGWEGTIVPATRKEDGAVGPEEGAVPEGDIDPGEWVVRGVRRLMAEVPAECVADGRVRVTFLRMEEAGQAPRYEAVVQLQPYTPPSPEVYAHGAPAILSSYRIDPAAVWSRHKTGNRLVYRLAVAEAAGRGAREAILCNTAGYVADGAVSTPFWVRDGVLYTPSLECGGLPGITRQAVLELAAAEGIAGKQGEYTANSLSRAEEIFCTNALVGILPLTSWNGMPVGTGAPGPYTLRLLEAYRREVERKSRAV